MAVNLSIEASGQTSPYPVSPVIESIEWAPVDSILQFAKDGDNWPVTWADDGAIYTTWGDGTGFPPRVERKLSCGFAKVTGSPPEIDGVNIRTEAEQIGNGRSGLKAWGILSVEGRLYLWFGHANRKGGVTRLAWSDDHAKTWTFADWTFNEFGLMGFINFGQDYHGARDEYVYAYSHDGPRADTPADGFMLMRAHKERVTDKSAWEFFAGFDDDSTPIWTAEIDRRMSVFSHPENCLRSAITYNSGIKRYLWWQQIPQPAGHPDRGDTRFDGGFAIYDAPEPWGPWTTVEFIPKWDVGPGEHGDFPGKWMSPDGTELFLVFSGDDAFCVRGAKLRLRGN